MTPSALAGATLQSLDAPTRALVRLAARITGGTEDAMRAAFAECLEGSVPAPWIEEVILQSYLFAGFPRALNAAREWRRLSGIPAPDAASAAEGYASVYDWRLDGEATCATVYGRFYEKLRENIRALHPALDEWMIVEGYGKVLSRRGLDLGRRELCIVAACVAAAQDRQLHSHLHGARHAGVADGVVREALEALAGAVVAADLARAVALWDKVARQEPRSPSGH